MKLKAVLLKGCLPEMQVALESEGFYAEVVKRVLLPHLHMKEGVGPAECYIQKCDIAVGRKESLCEVRLSGVSVNNDRSTNDFYRARRTLERLYHETLLQFLKKDERLQLMVSLMLDQPPFGEKSSLIERRGGAAIWITGGKSLPPLVHED